MLMLRRKLWRDIKENKGVFAALCIIIAMALCVFVGMNMTMLSLGGAIDDYYRDYRFADVFASVEGISHTQAERLTEIEGIAQVTARLIQEERVLFDDSDDNVYLRLTSYEARDLTALNQAHVFAGPPLGQEENGIYLNPGFVAARDLQIGDLIPILIHGRRQELPLLGVAQSPEYVYAVSGSGEIFPNPGGFGIAVVPQSLMDQFYQMQGQANALSFRLSEGYSYDDVELLLRDRLQRHGLKELLPREDQVSHFMMDTEVTMMRQMGLALPVLLLLISAVMLIITLKRRVEQQRGQIGILLAFGYTHREILRHYMEYGVLVGLVGGLAGLLMGLGLLNFYVVIFREFFTLPAFDAGVSWPYLVIAPLLAISFAVAACAIGCREMMRLQPAEAMRPPAPLAGGRVFLERVPLFWGLLTTSGKMAVRNMIRTPFRSFVSLLGVALVFAMMTVVFSFNNMMQLMITDQYEQVEVYDAKVTFSGLREDGLVRRELNHYPGLELVETMLELPCTLRYQNLSLDTVALGLAEEGQLYNVLDAQGTALSLDPEQVILAKTLADQLTVQAGDMLYLDSPYLPEAKPLVITAVIPQYVGANLYLNRELLWQLIDGGQPVNAAMLLAPEGVIAEFKSDYRLSTAIAGISRADEMFAMMADYLDAFMALIFMLGLGVGMIGFVIVYNSAVISFSERSRELASLLVLGLDEGEAAQVISFEQWVLAFCGIIVGVPLTIAVNTVMVAVLNNELYALPERVPGVMFLLAAVVTCGYLALAQLQIKRKMRSLVIVDVLKERE